MVGRPLRIGLVVERFSPHGGVEHVAWEVAHRLARAGERVHVFCRTAEPPDAGAPGAPGAPAGPAGPAGPDTAGTPDRPGARGEGGTDTARGPTVQRLAVPRGWQPLRVLRFSRAAQAACRAASLDVVQSFSRTRHQDVYRAGGGCHASYMERAYGQLGARVRRLSPRHAVLLGIESAVFGDPQQTLLCNSEMVAREIRARHAVPPERLVVLTNGVDLDRFHPATRERRREPVRHALGVDAHTPVWLLAGHGFARKGLDTAMAALARARAAGVLWVAGGDDPRPFRAAATRLGVAERVRFLGRRDDLPDLLAAADALVLPTRYDAFANVCLEAAAAGLPVLTSEANGAADLLREAGLVVRDPDDADGFARALERLADPSLRQALGQSGRKIAETTGWDQHVEALRALLRNIHAGGDAASASTAGARRP